MAPSNADALRVLERNTLTPTPRQFCEQVQQSLLYQYNAADSLYAQPTILSIIGALYTATATTDASNINLKPTAGPWKYMAFDTERGMTLKACLMSVADLGIKTMNTYSISNEKITSHIDRTIGQLNQVASWVSDLPESAFPMREQLHGATRSLDASIDCAQEFEKSLDNWLLSITELYQSTAEAQGSEVAGSNAEAANMHELQAEIVASGQVQGIDMQALEQAARRLLEDLTMSQEFLLRLNEHVPSAWQSSIQSINEAINRTGPSIVAQSLPSLYDAAVWQKPTHSGSPESPLSLAPSSRTPPTDRAYVIAALLEPLLEELSACLTQGSGSGTGWAKLREQDSGAGIDWLYANIKALHAMARPGSSTPGKALESVFLKTIETIESIKSAATSDQILVWQADIQQVKTVTVQLMSTFESFPGTAGEKVMAITINNPGHVQGADVPAQAAAVSTAVAGISIHQRALQIALQTNNFAAESATKLGYEFDRLSGKFSDLQNKTDIRTQVKKILVLCAAALVLLKVQNRKMKALFGASSIIIRHVLQPRIEQFIQDESFNRKEYMKELALSNMMGICLQSLALMSLIRDIYKTHFDIYHKYIMQGMSLVSELSMMASQDPRALPRYNERLIDFMRRARQGVEETVQEKRRKSNDVLKGRIDDFERKAQEVERQGVVPDADTRGAIGKGGAVITDYVKEHASSIFGSVKFDT